MRMLAAALAIVPLFMRDTDAALPPGYEDEMYCPSEFCLRGKPPREDGMVGGKSLFFECHNPTTGIVEEIKTWGAKKGKDARQKLVDSGHHTERCEDYLDPDGNVKESVRARLAAGIGKLAKTERKTKKPTLLYFPMPGRALPCRVALFHTLGKAGWTDRHIGFEEFRTEQQAFNEGKKSQLVAAPFVPQLELPSGVKVAEAVPISKWAATQGSNSDLYPEGDDRLLVDEAISIIYGAMSAPSAKDEELKKQLRTDFANGPLKAAFKLFEARLSARSGPFVMGTQITLADLWAYFVVNVISSGMFDHVPVSVLDEFPAIRANFNATIESDLMTRYKAAYADQYQFDN